MNSYRDNDDDNDSNSNNDYILITLDDDSDDDVKSKSEEEKEKTTATRQTFVSLKKSVGNKRKNPSRSNEMNDSSVEKENSSVDLVGSAQNDQNLTMTKERLKEISDFLMENAKKADRDNAHTDKYKSFLNKISQNLYYYNMGYEKKLPSQWKKAAKMVDLKNDRDFDVYQSLKKKFSYLDKNPIEWLPIDPGITPTIMKSQQRRHSLHVYKRRKYFENNSRKREHRNNDDYNNNGDDNDNDDRKDDDKGKIHRTTIMLQTPRESLKYSSSSNRKRTSHDHNNDNNNTNATRNNTIDNQKKKKKFKK